MVQSNQDAVVLLAKGRVAKAKQMFFDLVQKSASYPNLQALFLHNYGIATMRMGDLEEAYQRCNTALSSGWLTRKSWFGPGVYVQLCAGMAILQTLRGELEDARNWLEQAKEIPTESSQAEIVSAEMLFLVRTGEWDKALQLYHRSFHEFKDLLPAPALRRMYLLRAFAEEQQKGSSYREVASELTFQLRDASATEFAFLTTRWRELQEFVAHLGFSSPQGIDSETYIS